MDLFIILMLSLITFISSQKEELYNLLDGKRVNNIYRKVQITENSKIECAHICKADKQCIAANYKNSTLSCELSVYHPADIASNATEGDGWTLMYKPAGLKDNWTPIFRGTSRIGIDVADSFIGTNVNSLPSPEPGCYSRESLQCNTHVRSFMIDSWKALLIQQVKVEMVIDGQTAAYIIFQNRETDDKTTWFRPENILNSSWTDLPSETSMYPNFQLERLSSLDSGRSFHVFHTIVGCPSDVGWMFVSEVAGTKYCSFDVYSNYPAFKYTTGSTKQMWETSGAYVEADVLLISIQG